MTFQILEKQSILQLQNQVVPDVSRFAISSPDFSLNIFFFISNGNKLSLTELDIFPSAPLKLGIKGVYR